MSKFSGKVSFDDPVEQTDAVNLRYLNTKIDELTALITAAVVEFRDFNSKPVKTSELINDSKFVNESDVQKIQKGILQKILNLI